MFPTIAGIILLQTCAKAEYADRDGISSRRTAHAVLIKKYKLMTIPTAITKARTLRGSAFCA